MFGIGIFWLSPGVPRSVAAKGMPELAVDGAIDPASAPLKPGVAEAMPDEPLVPAEPHPEAEEVPPPSNEAFEPAFGHGIVSGLIPDGVSSVAPRGMALTDAPEDDSDGWVPSGEVAPMPVVEPVCA
jgi:hypothetical protein